MEKAVDVGRGELCSPTCRSRTLACCERLNSRPVRISYLCTYLSHHIHLLTNSVTLTPLSLALGAERIEICRVVCKANWHKCRASLSQNLWHRCLASIRLSH